MNDEMTSFGLSCRDPSAPAPVLTCVHAQGRLDAVLFDLTLRQTYRNTSEQVLEVVYTFPLPPMAVLLGFASELNGSRREGVIVPWDDAERTYEESLEEGDAPVMLEAHGGGLHTANIGNLKPGDEIVLEARFGQLLGFEQGRLRVSIPTTIAPRYGNAERSGLQPQQVPLARVDAEYPLALNLTLGEGLAGAKVECPTHRFTATQDKAGATCLDLSPGAWLDRDVVVIVTPREPHPSLIVRANDPFNPSAPIVMMAALQAPVGAPRERISLKLLVDCSGSMNGDSIHSARAALHGIVAGLSEHDGVSLSRFGSTVEHLYAVSSVKPVSIRQLQSLIAGIQADLGGTEMEAALKGVFELPYGGDPEGVDVLLVTDGEIWQAEETIAAARRSGHRIFAIGVGASPAEGLLRSLAEATGGACEFATPGEALEAAAQRMLHRVRQPVLNNVRLDWGGTPVWTTGPAPGLFGGDTVIALAGLLKGTVSATSIRLLADDARGRTLELARGEANAPCPGDSLARIAAARRIGHTTETDGLALALQYQLMTKQTNCILVHQRADADKAVGQALHRVNSMLSAGWAGLGTTFGALGDLAPSPKATSSVPPSAESLCSFFGDVFEVGAVRRPGMTAQEPLTLEVLARSLRDRLAQGLPLEDLRGGVPSLHPSLSRAIDDLAQLGLSVQQASVLLAHWTNTRRNGLADTDLARLLQPLLAGIDPALSAASMKLLERELGGFPIDGWATSRSQRLLRSVSRSRG